MAQGQDRDQGAENTEGWGEERKGEPGDNKDRGGFSFLQNGLLPRRQRIIGRRRLQEASPESSVESMLHHGD